MARVHDSFRARESRHSPCMSRITEKEKEAFIGSAVIHDAWEPRNKDFDDRLFYTKAILLIFEVIGKSMA